MAPPLKVFRTPIGFHDAYVAAPSQKAALKTWGADANLFARGVAEQVSDPALMAEPLAHPGKVVKRPRASSAEHFASLAEVGEKAPRRARPTSRPAPNPKPRPSRAALDRAEQALADQQRSAADDLAELKRQQAQIAAQIDRLRTSQGREAARLESQVKRVRKAYDAALDRWRNA